MNFSFLKEKGNKYIIYILLGLLVVIVLFPTKSVDENLSIELEEVVQDELECRLENVLSSMEGVGDVEVMITTTSEKGSLFGEKSESNVCGVVVVAEGAGIPTVNSRISEVVKALFSIDVHKISIVKMKSGEE